jgi:hypothetical protein
MLASAVDHTMVNSDVNEIEFNNKPTIGMSFKPGVEPGIVVALSERQTLVIPGYRVQSNGVAFDVGISCKADLTDECHEFIYSDDYQSRSVYVRYVQTSDSAFRPEEGARIGESWQQIIDRLAGNEIIYSANDSCVRMPSGWHACIDLMSVDREFDPKARRLLPKNTARVAFYYKQ